MSGTECDELLAEIDRYLDGELPAEEKARIERHMVECGSCFRREGFVREVRDLIRRKCGAAAPMPEDMAERILGAIRALPLDD